MTEPAASRARRFERQILLLGNEGQAALDEAVAHVAGAGPAHEIATAYARAAGFREVVSGAIDIERLGPSELFEHEAPRALIAGARAVLSEIVRATSVGRAP